MRGKEDRDERIKLRWNESSWLMQRFSKWALVDSKELSRSNLRTCAGL